MSDLNNATLTLEFTGLDGDGNSKCLLTGKTDVPMLVVPHSESVRLMLGTMDSGRLIVVNGELGTNDSYFGPYLFAYGVASIAEGTAINTVTAVGRLGKVPQMKYFEDGSCVTSGSIAVNGWRNGVKTVNWLNIRAYAAADRVGRGDGLPGVLANCDKGALIGVTGKLSMSPSGNGKPPYHDINIVKLALLGGKQSTSNKEVNPEDFQY